MKNNLSRLILISFDLLAVYISIVLAFYTRVFFDNIVKFTPISDLYGYTSDPLIYIIVLATLFYDGVYTQRYDFWHESRLIIKSFGLSFLLVFTLLAFTKHTDHYSVLTIFLVFMYLTFFIPLFKNILKKKLYQFGLWQREVKIYSKNKLINNEIFNNPYLGYIDSRENAKTVFVNSQDLEVDEFKNIIDTEIRKNSEVIFVPLLNDYNMVNSKIYELSNTRTNLIVLQNRLQSRFRLFLQQIFNYALALFLLPVLLPLIAILAFLIKRESEGPVFFAHNRIGKNGAIIPTLKFRSMFSDAQERLNKLLAEDDNIRREWETNFKLKDDPRVTKIGAILRKTSLDELPQIFNVLKGEMNFVGPRPVIQQELDNYYKDNAEYYYMVKPGITGLWQVSGRSDTDYDFRVSIDKWYVVNWSIWLDIIILLKTVKVVLFREGAY
ncbi:MAG: sugar transferase [Sulfuricurvum sp.]|nr:sugar transferase [Sulfuricurvum sp.]